MTTPTLGATIAAKRKEKSLTQYELAEKMNVSDKAVSKWERNISCPDIDSFARLTDILGLSADELLHLRKTTSSKLNTIGAYTRFGLVVAALVCGVVVAVLAILNNSFDLRQLVILLGVGLAALSIVTLDIIDDKDNL